ncbi:MAG: LPS export ABC transporter permease LptF [Alphaproteobacteria bacterium]
MAEAAASGKVSSPWCSFRPSRYNPAVHRYQLYLMRQLIGPFVLVAFGLTAVIWLSQSLRFIDFIVNKGLSLGTFLYLGMLLMPSFLGAILPIALFCAILFVYNRLTLDSEMISMRAAGRGPWGIAAPVLVLAGAVAVLAYAINLYLSPASYREFKDQQFVIRGDYSSLLLQEGVFTPLGSGMTVYVRARGPGGVLLGILVHDERDIERPITMMAEQGALVSSPQGPRFVLRNGNRQEIDRERGQLSLLYFDRYALDLGQFSEEPGSRWREPRERFLHELLNPSASDDDQRNLGKFRAEFHQRLISPLYAFALVLIGLAALTTGDHNRRGQWRRILLAIGAGFAFEAVALGLTNIVAKDPSLVVLLYLNLAVGLILPTLVLNRGRLMRKRRPSLLGGEPAQS